MIYSALAAVIIAGLAWDFGRRWLVAHERAKEAALIRAQEMRDEFTHALIRLEARIADLEEGGASDLNKFEARLFKLETAYGDSVSALQLRVRELGDRLTHTNGTLVEHRCIIDKLETQPAEAADVRRFDAAILNVANQLKELSQTAATKEQLKAEIDRINAVMSGGVAKGARRFA